MYSAHSSAVCATSWLNQLPIRYVMDLSYSALVASSFGAKSCPVDEALGPNCVKTVPGSTAITLKKQGHVDE